MFTLKYSFTHLKIKQLGITCVFCFFVSACSGSSSEEPDGTIEPPRPVLVNVPSDLIAKTLMSSNNDGIHNGSAVTKTKITRNEVCEFRSVELVPEEQLDNCLSDAIEAFNLRSSLEDLRAFSARINSYEEPKKVDLGMRSYQDLQDHHN